ncbi:GNAT family N-acetyltransferase, partial [bacterium]
MVCGERDGVSSRSMTGERAGEITIRRAVAADAAAVRETIRAVYDEYGFPWYPEGYHLDLYEFDSHYIEPDVPFWVAELDGTIRGTAALMLHPLIAGEGVVTVDGVRRVGGTDSSLERVYVHPDARRQGLARGLNEAAIAHARALGGLGIEIWSDKEFAAAHALYR